MTKFGAIECNCVERASVAFARGKYINTDEKARVSLSTPTESHKISAPIERLVRRVHALEKGQVLFRRIRLTGRAGLWFTRRHIFKASRSDMAALNFRYAHARETTRRRPCRFPEVASFDIPCRNDCLEFYSPTLPLTIISHTSLLAI